MNLRKLPFYFACALAMAMFLDGFLRIRVGFDRFATMYYFSAIILFLSFSAGFRVPRGMLAIVAICVANYSFNPVFAPPGILAQALGVNIQYLVRTVGVFFAAFVYFYNTEISLRSYRMFFVIQLAVIFFALMADFLFGFGDTLNARGEVREIVASFFWSGNSTAFLAAMSLAGVAFCGGKAGPIVFAFAVLQAVTISVLMDSKALFVGIVVTCGIYFFPFLNRGLRTRFVLVLACAVGAVLAASNLSQIAEFALSIYSAASADPSRTIFMAQNYGALAALSSMRVDGLLLVWGQFADGSAAQILFGRTFFDLIYLEMLVEIDLMDTLYSGGLVGLSLLFVSLSVLFRIAFAREKLLSQFGLSVYTQVSLILVVLFATLSGHVFLHPTSMTVFGLLVGVLLRSVRVAQAARLRTTREIAFGQ